MGKNGGTDIERCDRCGAQVYQFSKKLAQSNGRYFCVRCAEELDRDYLIKNSCSVCGKIVGKYEVKFVLPSSMYGSSLLPLMDRLACTSCYDKLRKKNVTRLISTQKSVTNVFRESLKKQIAKSLA
jgi:ribosomal protein L37E